ncbi:molecular chaperone [Salmonella enterica]|nr:molecular chaperone [Salmonella enterica]EGM2983857.1 molecular chaperone [Salmonella enterica]
MKRIYQIFYSIFTVWIICCTSPAEAGFSLGKTRLVLPQQSKETILPVINDSPDTVYMVKVRVSLDMNGREVAHGLIASPPMFRLNPQSTNNVRLRITDNNTLPADRESLFYVTTGAVPGSSVPLRQATAADNDNTGGKMATGVGFVIKAVYRPSVLPRPDLSTWKKLTFSRVPGGIMAKNPTPYYIALSGISVDGQSVKILHNITDLLVPYGQQIYGTRSIQKKQITFSVYDDLGGLKQLTSSIE